MSVYRVTVIIKPFCHESLCFDVVGSFGPTQARFGPQHCEQALQMAV